MLLFRRLVGISVFKQAVSRASRTKKVFLPIRLVLKWSSDMKGNIFNEK